MTDTTHSEPITPGVDRHIGGERAHRGFFGGTQPPGRVAGLAAAFLIMLITTPLIGVWGVILATAIGVGTVLLTQRTHRGSILERRTRRRRWTQRRRAGTHRYLPYRADQWDALQTLTTSTDKTGRADAARELAAMRAMPDGADGMGWLQSGTGLPGIAWHAPLGEEPYLSVVFAVAGQAHGVESASAMRRAAEAWGMFLASRAAPTSLTGGIQTLTRVLPPDTALQEFWVLEALDPQAPADAIASYDDVLRLTGSDAMVQRHYVTVRWPLTGDFLATAAKHGPGRDGWRALMGQEITGTLRGLSDARLGHVEVLSARRVAALIRHQQNPSRPVDFVADVTPNRIGLASSDEYSAHIVEDTDPITGAAVSWWHRTAAIRSENLATGPRNQLWCLDLLLGADLHCVRSLSFHLRLIPRGEAKSSARADLVRDRADLRSDMDKGRLSSDETRSNLTAASQRAADLGHGSPHHGAEWVGFVTITEPTRDQLLVSSKTLEETCATGLGIERLDWLDSYQSAASGSTWPIARGLAPAAPTIATRVLDRLAGTSHTEALT